MNCPQCQNPNAPDSVFCGKCGTRLADAAQQGTPVGTGYQQSPAGEQQAPAFSPGQPPAGGPYPPRAAGPAASFNLDRLTTVDKTVGIATLVTFITLWLPWYEVSGLGTTFDFDALSWGHGWMWIEVLLALALLAYLVARSLWDQLPFTLPVAHAPLLIVATGLQLLLILIDFAVIPYGGEGMGWGWAAFFGLIAACVAAGPVIYPAVRSYLNSRNAASGQRPY